MPSYDYLIRCSICGSDARQILDGINPDDHSAACRAGWKLMSKAGWQQPWFMHRQDVCPACMAQTEKAIVPGVGIELVPRIMIEQGAAVRLSDFLKAVQSDEQERK